MPRVAAIDIGTNSVLLTIAESGAQAPEPLLERARITRLGRDVDRCRRLSPEACAETLATLRDYATEIHEADAERVAVVGTSALRDAAGADDFLRRVELVVGVRPRVIDGAEEARLTFAGALSALGVQGPVLVCDIGGGSTEIITGLLRGRQAELNSATSLEIGSVRLSERHLRADPPAAEQVARLRQEARQALASVPPPPVDATMVGVAGTITTLAAVEQRLCTYDSARVHGARLSASAVQRLAHQLTALPLQRRRALPGLDPARADVVVAGAWIVAAALDWAAADGLVVSDRGVRWGLVHEMLG
jgi:exopolyphosphatase/guanosine-5'-triphosphate,3'-diphosphate pyrophosphatase